MTDEGASPPSKPIRPIISFMGRNPASMKSFAFLNDCCVDTF